MDKIKVVLVGASGVGKTTLFKRLMGTTLDSDYVPSTTAGVGAKLVQLEGHPPVVFELWDVPSQSFAGASIYGRYFDGTHAIVLVYSLEMPSSWEALPTYLEVARHDSTASQLLPIVMVGSKSDLVDEQDASTARFREEIREWCKDHAIPHIQVSSTAEWSSTLDILKLILNQLLHH